MRAQMRMGLDTVFGNRVELELMAELDNPHELTNRVLFTDMAKMLRCMCEEIRAANEQVLLADGDSHVSVGLVHERERRAGEEHHG